MSSPDPTGFSDRDAEFEAVPTPNLANRPASVAAGSSSFVQAERDRLRAGLLDTPAIGSADDPRISQSPDACSPPIEAVTARELMCFKELWLTRHQSVVASLPIGTCLTVDLGTGLYVTGGSRLDTSDRFDAIFGSKRSAWSHEVGVPVTLGSGLWALQSEA